MINLKALIDELKERVALTVAMERTELEITYRGSKLWRARCWLHPDENPSIAADTEKNLFYCYSTGCIAKGDVINFWQIFHSLTPFDAARDLAKAFGIDLARFQMTEQDTERTKLKDYMAKFTVKLMNKLLATPKALEYVTGRGVSEETIRKFQIGYSPKPLRHIPAASELSRDDMYTDAIVFPVIDYLSGDIFHYTRPMTPQSGQKYISLSHRWPLRWRGAMFGFQVAREVKGNTVVAVEGFFDALTLHSAGQKNAICTLGASIRQEQIDYLQMSRTKDLTILFDADRAGELGAQKALSLSRREIKLRLAFLPEMDPDEYTIAYGLDALKTVLGEAASPADYLINEFHDTLEHGDYYDKTQAIEKIMQLTVTLPQVERTIVVNRIKKLASLDESQVWDMVQTSEKTKGTEQSERQVLAHCIQERGHFMVSASKIPGDADYWGSHANGRLWDLICAGYNKGIKRLTPELLCNLDQTASEKELETLQEKATSELDYHLDNLHEAFMRRKLQSVAKRLSALMTNKRATATDIISEHLIEVASQASITSNLEFTAQKQVDLAMSYVKERMANQSSYPGINLGREWTGLMDSILGFQPGYMYLLAATPKAGKTACAQNWALTAAVQMGVPTLWIGLEMSERDLALRNLSIVSGISNLQIRRGQLSDKEHKHLQDRANKYYTSPFHMVNGAGMTVHEIINVMRKYVYTMGVKLIFLDYIQLINIKGPKGQELWEGHMNVSTALKNAVSKDLKVPLVAISQLNRTAGHEKSSGGSNIAGSYKYIQDCDCYMGLRKLTLKELDSGYPGNTMLDIEFNRHGPQDVQLRLEFNHTNLRIGEVT